MSRRAIRVTEQDTLLINGYRVSGEVLAMIIDPDPRVLWAFVRQNKNIQPIPYTEEKLIWLTPADLERTVDI